MKKSAIFLILIFIGLISFSQTATHEEVINKKKKGRITKYIADNGQEFSVGDTLRIGVPFRNDAYDYIQQNAGIAYYPLTAIASGSDVIIKKIKIYSKMVSITTTKPNGYVYGLYISNLEGAIKNSEIIDKDFFTPEQALKKLKMEKDKLDLGLITQEEYEKKKSELVKFIK